MFCPNDRFAISPKTGTKVRKLPLVFLPIVFFFVLLGVGNVVKPALASSSGNSSKKEGIEYEIVYQGIQSLDILASLTGNMPLGSADSLPVYSFEILKYRAQKNISLIKEVLASFGYYEASVSLESRQKGKKYKIIYTIDKGKAVSLNGFIFLQQKKWPLSDELKEKLIKSLAITLKRGDFFTSQDVLDGSAVVKNYLQNHGYPLANVADQKIIVDKERHSANVQYDVDCGPYKVFGKTRVVGLKKLNKTYVLQEITWSQGQTFDEREVEKTRRKLFFSGLFSSVNITYGSEESGNEGREQPILIELKESPVQTVGIGAHYMTSTGVGIKPFWESINLLGNAEKLGFSAVLAQQRQAVIGNFVKPNFLRKRQALHLRADVEKENLNAYKKRGGSFLVDIERHFGKKWWASVGASYEQARLEKEGKKQHYKLVGFPLKGRYKTLNPALMPVQGVKVQSFFMPYLSVLGSKTNFAQLKLKESIYFPLNEEKTTALKIWVGQGFMPGGSMHKVPPDKRFYLGGESSLRGYGYQMAGPLDSHKDPLGGRSFLDGGTEVIFPVVKNLDGVVFLEAGSIFSKNFPAKKNTMYSDGGIGARYDVGVGVLKLDIATPFRRRKKIDNVVQFYVSMASTF